MMATQAIVVKGITYLVPEDKIEALEDFLGDILENNCEVPDISKEKEKYQQEKGVNDEFGDS